MAKVGGIAEAADAGASAGAERDVALDGGTREPGERGRGQSGVGRSAIVVALEVVLGEEPADAGADGGEGWSWAEFSPSWA